MNMQNQKQSKLITTIGLSAIMRYGKDLFHYLKSEPWILPKPSAIVQNWDERFTITKYDANTAGSYNWTILCNFIGDEHRNYYGRYTVISYFNKSIARYFANNSIVVLHRYLLFGLDMGCCRK